MIFSLATLKNKIRFPKSRILLHLGGLFFLFATWTLISLLSNSNLVPAPWEILLETIALFKGIAAWEALLLTTLRVMLGFALAFILGLALGLIRGFNQICWELSEPLIIFFQGVPPLLWTIPILFLIGFGFLSPLLVIMLITFPLITINISEGIKTLPLKQKEMLAIFAPKRIAFFKELVFPHLRPHLLASLKLGLGLAVKSSVLAEFFAATSGLGFMLNVSFQNARLKAIYSWGLILILLIFFFETGIGYLIAILQEVSRHRTLHDKRLLAHSVPKQNSFSKPLGGVPKREAVLRLVFDRISFAYQYKNLKGHIKTSQFLFSNFSFSVEQGDLIVIWGDSGVGKTTLLKLAAGLIKPHQGFILRPQGRISFVFQEDRLLEHRSALANVALPLEYAGFNLFFAYKHSGKLLQEVGLSHRLFHLPTELSGGMKRRVSLARAFALSPSLLLLDEPLIGLQRKAREEGLKFILSQWQQHPCPALLVTHHPEEIKPQPFMRFYELKGLPAELREARPGNP